jgi:hypothetical protein
MMVVNPWLTISRVRGTSSIQACQEVPPSPERNGVRVRSDGAKHEKELPAARLDLRRHR